MKGFIGGSSLLLVLLGICSSAIARPLTLEYDCFFEIPMKDPYPPEIYDTESDGIFHIISHVSTETGQGRHKYRIITEKQWPIIEENSTVSEFRVRARRARTRRKRIFRLRNDRTFLELIRPTRKAETITARYTVFNPELYIGGACSSCRHIITGYCQKGAQE